MERAIAQTLAGLACAKQTARVRSHHVHYVAFLHERFAARGVRVAGAGHCALHTASGACNTALTALASSEVGVCAGPKPAEHPLTRGDQQCSQPLAARSEE